MSANRNEYKFFNHKACEYFPCHKGVETEEFNCLFCYCPLYVLGKKCGGNYRINKRGYKDCSGCTIPHRRENYERITGRYRELAELVKEHL